MRAIEYSRRAARDLESIALFIATEARDPAPGRKVLASIAHAIEQLAEFPAMGRELLDDDLDRGYRVLIVDDYRIVYAYGTERVLVQRIVHMRRNIDDYAYFDLS